MLKYNCANFLYIIPFYYLVVLSTLKRVFQKKFDFYNPPCPARDVYSQQLLCALATLWPEFIVQRIVKKNTIFLNTPKIVGSETSL